MIKSLCVYCGSSSGNDPKFERAGESFGKALADHGIMLVYGGAKVGVMGAVARGCLQNGGEVLGVIPEFLDEVEVSNYQATKLIITKTMHERKTIMAKHSEAFVALPGGMGTLEEIAEILTWAQLGLVNAPIGFLNIDGYYDHLFKLFKHMNGNGLLKDQHLSIYVESDDFNDLLNKLMNVQLEKQSIQDKLSLT